MTIEVELRDFYVRHGFGEVLGVRTRTVPVYTGCMLVPLPNIETRRRFLKYHDLHHLITGYSVGRIGEGEVSAWELGTGSAFHSPILGLMNLIALSTGLVLAPRRMWRAYLRGSRSDNLYGAEIRASIDSGRWNDVASLRAKVLEVRNASPVLPFRTIAFGVYGIVAMIIHTALAVPAVIIRFLTDTMLGASVFQAFKPTRRTDLY